MLGWEALFPPDLAQLKKERLSMQNKKDIRFFPLFVGATAGVLLEVIATLVDEIVVGNLFDDAAFAAINLVEPYMFFEIFIAYLLTVAAAAMRISISPLPPGSG